jgi:hypothetical protein
MLIRNGLTANMSPVTLLGGGFIAGVPDHVIAMSATAGGFGKLASMPYGYSHPYSIMMPITAGGMRAFRTIQGSGTATLEYIPALIAALTGAGAITSTATGAGKITAASAGAGALAAAINGAINAEAALSGDGDLAGAMQAVLAAVATLAGTGDISANIVGAINGAAALTGEGDIDGTLNAIWNMVAALAGESDLDAAITAIGHAAIALSGTGTVSSAIPTAPGSMSAEIVVTGDALSTANVADAILDAINSIEQGVTLREATRLILSAAAGKVSKAGDVITIRNAVADDTDRIIATTTTEGERTAITYDKD